MLPFVWTQPSAHTCEQYYIFFPPLEQVQPKQEMINWPRVCVTFIYTQGSENERIDEGREEAYV